MQELQAIQYEVEVSPPDLPALAGSITPRLEWSYTSSARYTGPELPVGLQHGFNLLNARLSYRFLEDRAQIALWAKNLTDEKYFSFVTALGSTFGFAVRYYEPPLTFGAELSLEF